VSGEDISPRYYALHAAGGDHIGLRRIESKGAEETFEATWHTDEDRPHARVWRCSETVNAPQRKKGRALRRDYAALTVNLNLQFALEHVYKLMLARVPMQSWSGATLECHLKERHLRARVQNCHSRRPSRQADYFGRAHLGFKLSDWRCGSKRLYASRESLSALRQPCIEP
jgi:hypothetical protein